HFPLTVVHLDLHYFPTRRSSDLRPLLASAALLMAGTGIGFALVHGFWPLLLVAFVGTLNPSAGDVSVFLPLEQSVLSRNASAKEDRKSTRLNSSHVASSYAVFCL